MRPRRLIRAGTSFGRIFIKDILRKTAARHAPEHLRDERIMTARLATIEEIKQQVGNLKGLTIKLAQMAGYLDSSITPELSSALATFQTQAPTISFELVQQVLEEELGDRTREFAEIDPEPVAAASIGQVHWGRLHDGSEVAIKVQFPTAAELIEADLGNAGLLTGLLRLAFPAMETGQMAEELTERIREELDYAHEAKVQRRFHDFYRGHPYIVIPAVHDRLSGRRVLTSAFEKGVLLDQLLTTDQTTRDHYGELIFRFVFRSLYQLGLFNGDPHPGNYLVLPNGRMAFLDFGFSKAFSANELQLFESMIRAMVVEGDAREFRDIIYRAGLLTEPDLDPEPVREYFKAFYDLVLDDRVIQVTDEYATGILHHTFMPSNPLAKYLNVPRTFVVIQRINLGLYALLGRLDATRNWRRIAAEIWPFVNAPPSTAIGEDEWRWRNDS